VAARVLVAYATKMGSNAAIADAIVGVLRESGLEADALPAREVRDLDPYDAVVLGSALYAAHWRRDAHRLVSRRRDVLRTKPLWLWSSGPLDRALAIADLPPAANVLAILGDVPFRKHKTFGGRLDPDAPGVDEQVLRTHRVGDFRDWGAIRAYAAEIASEVAAAVLRD
jgi:menaquinone-dependent protoporphyrinogen oxidase